jgi:hypothetical protein
MYLGPQGIVRWWAQYTGVRSGVIAVLDGVLILEFDKEEKS